MAGDLTTQPILEVQIASTTEQMTAKSHGVTSHNPRLLQEQLIECAGRYMNAIWFAHSKPPSPFSITIPCRVGACENEGVLAVVVVHPIRGEKRGLCLGRVGHSWRGSTATTSCDH